MKLIPCSRDLNLDLIGKVSKHVEPANMFAHPRDKSHPD